MGAHYVRFHDTGVKRIHHPVIGNLSLTYETMELSADADQTVAVSTAEPGSSSEEALNLLASWAARRALASDARSWRAITPQRSALGPEVHPAGAMSG